MTDTEPKHISEIEITGFRGIAKGKLTGLAPLTILTGQNGSGKSSVLEALFICLSARVVDALVHCGRRRLDLLEGARWVFYQRPRGRPGLELTATRSDGRKSNVFDARIPSEASTDSASIEIAGSRLCLPSDGKGPTPQSNWINPDYVELVPEVRFIESFGYLSDVSLADRLSRTTAQRRAEVNALISEAVEGARSLDVFTARGTPYVGITFSDHIVPLDAMGDGVRLFGRHSLELASLPAGLALAEEPDSHKHPMVLRATAKAIDLAVNRGVQVVLSTHSLEMVDALLEEATEQVAGHMALLRLRLDDGALRSSRLDGHEIRNLRTNVLEDLR